MRVTFVHERGIFDQEILAIPPKGSYYYVDQLNCAIVTDVVLMRSGPLDPGTVIIRLEYLPSTDVRKNMIDEMITLVEQQRKNREIME